MPKTHNIPTSRSPLFFIAGLLIAIGAAIYLDGAARLVSVSDTERINLTQPLLLEVPGERPLSKADRQAAQIAWAYFKDNTNPETGLANAVAGIASSTLWDQGSYLMALVSAYRLKILDEQGFDERVSRLLQSFLLLDLVDGQLPNKVYNTQSLAMVNYENGIEENGIGWSALDVSRMLLSFRVLERHAPQYGDNIRSVVNKWDLGAMAHRGDLIGTNREGGVLVSRQEGRIGYEQYGARAAAMWGMDVGLAFSARRIMEWETVEGVEIPIDLRQSASFQAISPTLSEPYILQGLEYGFDSESRILAEHIYLAQEARFKRTGIPTMVSEDHIDQPPYFLYSSVYSDGVEWAVLAESGEAHPDKRTLSLKAVFAWDAIFDTKYTSDLMDYIAPLGSATDGWPAGIYEDSQETNKVYTLNTNAVILEAIQFRAFGPLW